MKNTTVDYMKMPGHWVLANLGKTVLRPGGLEMTKWMLQNLHIQPSDTVVEFAPGLGITAQLTLKKNPFYIAIEQNERAAHKVQQYLSSERHQVTIGTAEQTGLDGQMATIVYGEAMLTMQSPIQKERIIQEAKRILKVGGLYAIHEMSLTPDSINDHLRNNIRKDLVAAIKVNALPLTVTEWQELLCTHGFEVEAVQTTPMHLLHPKRLIEDEGLFGVINIAKNVLLNAQARKRVLNMKATFTKHAEHLQGVCIIARRIH